MKKLIQKLQNIYNRAGTRQLLLVLGVFFVAGATIYLALPHSVFAISFSDIAEGLFGAIVSGILMLFMWIMRWFVELLGWLVGLEVGLLAAITQYGLDGKFAIPAVYDGWKITRDVVNSFYIVVMIVIAIATIIRWEKISFKKALPRLIISAILVNFSLTICMFMINFAASIMATFVNAIHDSWGTFVLGLRAPAYTAYSWESVGNLGKGFVQSVGGNTSTIENTLDSTSGAFLGLAAALFMLTIAVGTVFFYIVILVWRIVMLWILMIMAPVGFFMYGVPSKGEKYWSEWIDEFVQQVTVGPVITFFLYLVILFMVQNVSTTYGVNLTDMQQWTGDAAPLPTLVSDPQIIYGFIIAIGLMYASMEVTQKMSSRAGSWARQKAGSLTRYAQRATTWPARFAGGGISTLAKSKYAAGSKGVLGRTLGTTYGMIRGLENLAKAPAAYKEAVERKVKKREEREAGIAMDEMAQGKQFAPLVRSITAGNYGLLESEGYMGVLKRAYHSIADIGKKPTIENLEKQRDEMLNQDNVKKGYDNLSKEDKDEFKDQTKEDINKEIAKYDEVKNLHQLDEEEKEIRLEIKSLESKINHSEEVGDISSDELQSMKNQLDKLIESGQDKVIEIGLNRQRIEKNLKDIHNVEGADAILELEKNIQAGKDIKLKNMANLLNQQGVDIGKDQKIGEYVGNLEQTTLPRKNKLTNVRNQLGSLNKAQSAIEHSMRSSFADEQKKSWGRYRAEEEHPNSEILHNFLANVDSGDLVGASVDMLQSFRQGDIQGFLQDLAESMGQAKGEFNLIAEQGRKNLFEYLTKTAKFSDTMAYQILETGGKYNYEDKRLGLTNLVSRTAGGGRQIATDTERSAAIQKSISKMSLGELIGNRVNKSTFVALDEDGKDRVMPEAIEALKKLVPQVSRVDKRGNRFFQDPINLRNMSIDRAKILLDAGEKAGWSHDALTDLRDFIGKQNL